MINKVRIEVSRREIIARESQRWKVSSQAIFFENLFRQARLCVGILELISQQSGALVSQMH